MRLPNYNIIMVILTFFLFIFQPSLRIPVIIYSIMFILVEIQKEGLDMPSMDLKTVMIPLIISFIITIILSKTLLTDVNPIGLNFIIGLIYFKIVSYNEEAVFRVMLPKYVGPIFSTILYAIVHLALIFTITANMQLTVIYFVTTLVFGAVMMILYMKTKKFGIIDGIHWAFDLVKNGVI